MLLLTLVLHSKSLCITHCVTHCVMHCEIDATHCCTLQHYAQLMQCVTPSDTVSQLTHCVTAGQQLVRINLSEQTDMMDLLGADLPVEGGAPGQFAW